MLMTILADANANLQPDPYWVWMLVKAGTVCTALAAIYKYGIKPVRKKVKGWSTELTEFRTKIDYITAELRPNGGHSMRDQVDYIRKLVEKVHQRQLNFFQFKPYGIIEFDATGRCIWVNRGYLDIVQRHPEEILGNGWRNTFPEEIRDQVIREWMSAVSDGRDFMLKTEVEDKEGNRIPVDVRRLAMKSDSGDLLGYLGFMCPSSTTISRWQDPELKCFDCLRYGKSVADPDYVDPSKIPAPSQKSK